MSSDRHQVELRESCGRTGKRTEGARRAKDTTRRPTEPNNLSQGASSQRPAPTEDHAWTYETDVLLGFHVGPPTIRVEAVSDSDYVASLLIPLSYVDYLAWPRWDRIYLVLMRLSVPGRNGIGEGLSFSKKGRRKWEKEGGRV